MTEPLPLRFFNTRTRRVEPFAPAAPPKVTLYCCGPTVYNHAHIGNLRTYVFEDLLRRTLRMAGYDLHHVMNVTDVGHLESDADEGDDKMMLAAARERKSPWDIARFYEDEFFRHPDMMGIRRPDTVCRATEQIPQMI
ncbi:MAG: cysteine--tRNA ligase, partial [Rhodospirillaceae bacterium]|nr:cysteine--tRNA ligase [Rhodospirillaceae bacterium]